MKKPKSNSLGITCGSSDCEKGLHCFRVTKKKVSEFEEGSCQSCGATTVDWPRVQQRSLRDADNTFASLSTEHIRNFFMNLPLSQRAKNYAFRKGRIGLKQAIRKRLAQSIGPEAPFRDGHQTPMDRDDPNPIHNAQHATATCCRRCLEYWHGIQRGQPLTNDELDYLTALAAKYLDEKIPDLGEKPIKVPKIQRN